jgi:hypothetical protein
MTVTLIGSRAMKMRYPDARDPKGDWDYHAPSMIRTPYDGMRNVNGERFDVFVDPRLGAWNWGPIATGDELYTLKISHGYWDLHGTWDKHAYDIAFMQRHGARFIPELHDILLPIWKERYPRNPISLDKNAKDFFTDHVHYIYVHDTVHASVAYRDHPWYLDILKDGSEVLVDNSKFWALSLPEQLQLVREELYVIALERVLIPNGYQGSPLSAYRWALRRTAISLFKNKWATFLLLHLDELGRPDVDFVKRHRDNPHMLRLMEDE